jgi:hypothetical protein
MSVEHDGAPSFVGQRDLQLLKAHSAIELVGTVRHAVLRVICHTVRIVPKGRDNDLVVYEYGGQT